MVASEVHGVGVSTSGGLTTIKTNTSIESTFGKAASVVAADFVDDATHLEDITQAYLGERGKVFFVPGPSLLPVQNADVDDFHVGDIVRYTFDSGLGQISDSFRVVKKSVTVDASGQEAMTVDFG